MLAEDLQWVHWVKANLVYKENMILEIRFWAHFDQDPQLHQVNCGNLKSDSNKNFYSTERMPERNV